MEISLYMSKFILWIRFSNFFSNTVLRHSWMQKFLSAYSYFFKRCWRIRGNCLSAYGEYGEFRVVCGTQNCLRIRGKNLCVHGEDAKRHKTVNISFNNNTNLIFLKILSIYTVWDGLSPKTISRYCPFKRSTFNFLLFTLFPHPIA